MFLLTAPASPTPRHDVAMLDAARSAGVTKVVKLSAIGTGETIGGDITQDWYLAAQQTVRGSGMAWTLLRTSSFASNVLHWADAIKAGRPVCNLTGTGGQGSSTPMTSPLSPWSSCFSPAHNGHTYTLTGPELLSVAAPWPTQQRT